MRLHIHLSLALLLLAGSAQAQVTIEKALARATVAKQSNGAAYVQLKATSDDTLLSVESAVARKIELHTMRMDGDIMKMRTLDQLELKAGQTLAMQPGEGPHIMLLGLKQPLKVGESFAMTLNFRKAGKIKAEVKVLATLSDKAKTSEHGAGHHEHHHSH